MRTLALILLSGLIAGAASAEEATTSPAPIRAAVQKALPFLEQGGVKWHEDKNCLSCHHIPFMAWTHLEAGRRGIPVEQTKLSEWLAWCAEWAEPKGGDDVLAELLLFLPREVMAEPAAQKKLESLPALLTAKQKPDGSWTASGQFRGEQWPGKEADEVTTMLMLMGLNTSWADAAKVAPAREKAHAWLKENPAPQGTRSLTMRLWFGHRMGDTDRREALTKTLLSQQKPDGGWSWKISNEGSDPITTGEAIYALTVAGSPAWDAASRQRAADCLIKAQLPDGSWHQDHKRISAKVRTEPEKIATIDGIYSYFATGWATIGLLHLLPEAAVADAK